MHLRYRGVLCLYVLLVLIALVPCSSQTSSEEPALSGYVTRVASPSDFDVNGVRVVMDNPRSFYSKSGNVKAAIPQSELTLYVGVPVQVYGRLKKKTHTISATEVILQSPSSEKVNGSGVIDAVLNVDTIGAPNDHLVRADGNRVLISQSTSLTINPPMDAASAFHTNVWLTYQGTRRADGVVVAEKAVLTENAVTRSEEKLRSKSDYDPAAVDPKEKQSGLSKAFVGINPKKIPPYQDAAMQARVESIGAKLIPKYQRDLPDTDASKIDFRFQVVDNNKWHDAIALPDGVILIPHQVVERMQNDSQLATVLADNMACVLEKQAYKLQPTRHKMSATQAAGDVAGFFVPGLALATMAANSSVAHDLRAQLQRQSSRVALFLLQDAGFDISQAPLAWWRLASSHEITDTRMPPHAGYVYKALGETWRSAKEPQATPTQQTRDLMPVSEPAGNKQ